MEYSIKNQNFIQIGHGISHQKPKKQNFIQLGDGI